MLDEIERFIGLCEPCVEQRIQCVESALGTFNLRLCLLQNTSGGSVLQNSTNDSTEQGAKCNVLREIPGALILQHRRIIHRRSNHEFCCSASENIVCSCPGQLSTFSSCDVTGESATALSQLPESRLQILIFTTGGESSSPGKSALSPARLQKLEPFDANTAGDDTGADESYQIRSFLMIFVVVSPVSIVATDHIRSVQCLFSAVVKKSIVYTECARNCSPRDALEDCIIQPRKEALLSIGSISSQDNTRDLVEICHV